ncbi:MAG: alginate export family protein [Leptospira sp.]|nr:alginate export family protein [Leptospira sp.]
MILALFFFSLMYINLEMDYFHHNYYKATTVRKIIIVTLLLFIVSKSIFSQGKIIKHTVPARVEKDGKSEEWIDGLILGGLIRFRPEMKNNYNFDKSQNENVNFSGQKIQFYIHHDFSKDLEAKITFQDTRVWGGERGSMSTTNTANDTTRQATDIRESWLTAKKLFDMPLHVKMGRQIMVYGDERLVGALDWTNVGRSFDGVKFMLEEKYFSTHIWGMIIGENNSDIAGNTTALGNKNQYNAKFNCPPEGSIGCKIVPDAPEREFGDSYFTGLYNTIKLSNVLHVDLYYLGLQKKILQANNAILLQSGNLGTPESRSGRMDILNTYGIRITNKTQPGRTSKQEFDYSVEYVIQSGTTGANIKPSWDLLNTQVEGFDPLTGKNYRTNYYKEKVRYDTYAYAIDAGYKFDMIRFGVGYDVGSGDPNRKDGSVATFQNLFHTNHIWYGLADQVSWVNMVSKSVNLTFYTKSKGTFRMDYYIVDKHKRQDGWYEVSGALRSGISTESISNNKYDSSSLLSDKGSENNRPVSMLGNNLFREIDFLYSIEYKSINWVFGYSLIFAGDSIKNQVDDSTKSSTAYLRKNFSGTAEFGYIMVIYAF